MGDMSKATALSFPTFFVSSDISKSNVHESWKTDKGCGRADFYGYRILARRRRVLGGYNCCCTFFFSAFDVFCICRGTSVSR